MNQLPLLIVEGPSDVERFVNIAQKTIVGFERLLQIKSAGGKENVPRIAAFFKKENPEVRVAAIIDGDQRYLPKQAGFYEKLAKLQIKVEFLENKNIDVSKNNELLLPFFNVANYLVGEGNPKDYSYLKDHDDFIWCDQILISKELKIKYPRAYFWGLLADGLHHVDVFNCKHTLITKGFHGMPGSDNLLSCTRRGVALVTVQRPGELFIYFDGKSIFSDTGFNPGLGSIKSLSFHEDEKLHIIAQKGSFDFDLTKHTFIESKFNEIHVDKRIPCQRGGRMLPNDGHRRIVDLNEKTLLMHNSHHGFIYPFALME